MPNILAKKEICPEFMQEKATPTTTSTALKSLINNQEKYQAVINELSLIKPLISVNQCN